MGKTTYSKKKKGSSKGIKAGIAIMLVIIIGLAVAGGFGWRYALQYKSTLETLTGSAGDVPTDENNEIEQVLNNGFAVTGESGTTTLMSLSVEPYAESSGAGEVIPMAQGYAFEAIVKPAESVIDDFTYSADFKNASSAWAQGKAVTDYVTLTVDSENPRKATVKVNKAFGEPIIISCTYNEDTSIKVTRQLDFVKPVSYTDVSEELENIDAFYGDLRPTVVPHFGIGTIEGNVQLKEGWLFLDSGSGDEMKNSSYWQEFERLTNNKVSLRVESGSYISNHYIYSADTSEKWFTINGCYSFLEFADGYSESQITATAKQYLLASFKYGVQ